MTDLTAPTTATGRRRPRPAERRTNAVDAFIDLVLERGEHPRPEEVAERAGVSIASLYRYFRDLDELRDASIARLVERHPELFVVPDIGRGDRDERISAFVASRVALHEELHPLELLGFGRSLNDEAAARHYERGRATLEAQIRRHFETELGQITPSRRADVIATIEALTSVETWRRFRDTHRRSPAQTRRAWIAAIDAVLPASAEGPARG